jgi:Tfp pilus assembly protein PilN
MVFGTAPAPAAVPNTIGTLSVTGLAGTHDDVAAWLTAMAKQRGVADVYFSTSTLVPASNGVRSHVTFTSTAVLTADLLSGRYSGPDGGLR